VKVTAALCVLATTCVSPGTALAQSNAGAVGQPHVADPDSVRWSSFLPLMREEATKRGIELPLPFGAGLVYYHLSRDIAISDVRVGRNGAPPQSASDVAQLAARANVENVNFKLDVWLLPFVNLYLITGYIWNSSDT